MHNNAITCISINEGKLNGKGNGLIIGNDDLMFATGSNDRSINIYVLQNAFNKRALATDSLVLTTVMKHMYRIVHIDWDPFDTDRFLNICSKYINVQIWTINPYKVQQDIDL